jgi:hypothetical protein
MPVVLEVPVGVGGKPVVAVAVEDDPVVVWDSVAAEQPTEVLGTQKSLDRPVASVVAQAPDT